MRGELPLDCCADFLAEKLVFESFCDFRAHRRALDLLVALKSAGNKSSEDGSQYSAEGDPYGSRLKSLYEAYAKQACELLVTENNKRSSGRLALTHALPQSQFDEVVTQLKVKFSQLGVSRPRVILVDWDDTLCAKGEDDRVDVDGLRAFFNTLRANLIEPVICTARAPGYGELPAWVSSTVSVIYTYNMIPKAWVLYQLRERLKNCWSLLLDDSDMEIFCLQHVADGIKVTAQLSVNYEKLLDQVALYYRDFRPPIAAAKKPRARWFFCGAKKSKPVPSPMGIKANSTMASPQPTGLVNKAPSSRARYWLPWNCRQTKQRDCEGEGERVLSLTPAGV